MRRLLYLALTAAFLCIAARPAHAEGDRVSFLHDIHISNGEQAHDLVCILCSIHIDGPVEGDTVAILGSIHSAAPMEGNAVTILGSITLTPGAHIGQQAVAILGAINQQSSEQIGGDTVQLPFDLILIPIGLLVLLIWMLRLIFRRPMPPYPLPPRPPFQ